MLSVFANEEGGPLNHYKAVICHPTPKHYRLAVVSLEPDPML